MCLMDILYDDVLLRLCHVGSLASAMVRVFIPWKSANAINHDSLLLLPPELIVKLSPAHHWYLPRGSSKRSCSPYIPEIIEQKNWKMLLHDSTLFFLGTADWPNSKKLTKVENTPRPHQVNVFSLEPKLRFTETDGISGQVMFTGVC